MKNELCKKAILGITSGLIATVAPLSADYGATGGHSCGHTPNPYNNNQEISYNYNPPNAPQNTNNYNNSNANYMYNVNAQQNQPTVNSGAYDPQAASQPYVQPQPNMPQQHVNAEPAHSSWWGEQQGNNEVSWGKHWGPYTDQDVYDQGNYLNAYEQPYPYNNTNRDQAYRY
jgi:hypothetical protein